VSETVLDRLVAALDAAAASDGNAFEPPVAILWTDKARQWEHAVGLVRSERRVLCLGAFSPDDLTGPAYWIRCAVGEAVTVNAPSGLPIVYLPGVSRSELQAVPANDQALAPLAGLQHRSQWFTHPNGKDWTVASLLMNADRGLGLQVATDGATAEALVAAVDHVLREPIARLRDRVVDAPFVNSLLNPDPARLLLRWIDDPSSAREQLAPGVWDAFVSQCKSDYNFKPDKQSAVDAAALLARADGPWQQVWKQFAEHPEDYPNVPDRLRAAKPMDLFTQSSLAWPQDNEVAEDQLRARLTDLVNLTTSGARKEIAELEAEHHLRRGSVWSTLRRTPLAMALEHLATVATLTATPVTGSTVPEIAAAYADVGWKVDLATLRALGEVESKEDLDAVSMALVPLYNVWLDQGARALQTAIGPSALATSYAATPAPAPVAGEVVVFVDGLRLDIAHILNDHLTGAGVGVSLETSFAALPTITQTAKPVLVPIDQSSLTAGGELDACRASSGASAGVAVLRSLLGDVGLQVLDAQQTGDPTGRAWTEAGNVDHLGHDRGIGLARELDVEVGVVARRVRELLNAGWKQVTLVTDHGWLLVPTGLPKNESLPIAATIKKKGRCARLKEGAHTDLPTVPWHWDTNVRVAVAPGISCFEANQVYEHGGISPQECVVPRLRVTASDGAPVSGGLPEITNTKWRGLALTVEYTDLPDGAKVDLRRQAGDPATTIAERAHVTGVAGRVVLMVSDDDFEGQPAHLVIVDAGGAVLVQRETTVGRN